VEQYGDRTALITGAGVRISYNDLRERVAEAVSIFRILSCAAGDRIAIWLPNCPEWSVLQYAAALLGLVIVPINLRYRAAEAEFALRLSGAKVLFVQDAFLTNNYIQRLEGIARGPLGRDSHAEIPALSRLEYIVRLTGAATVAGTLTYQSLLSRVVPAGDLAELAACRAPEDPLWIFWTSGTTSEPKGARLPQSAIENVWNWTVRVRLGSHDRVLVSRPYFYIAGNYWCMLAPILHGALAVIGQMFTPNEIVTLCRRERVTVLSGNPLLLKAVVDDPSYDAEAFKYVRFGYLGGSGFSTEDLRVIKEKIGYQYVIHTYGMTELEGFVTSTDPDDRPEIVAGSCGTPLPDFKMKLRNIETGEEVYGSGEGELCTNGRGLLDYQGISTADRARLFDAQGWFRTGDLMRRRDDGRWQFLGRVKDLIKVGGENVSSGEIEAVLIRHPKIKQATVISVPDPRRGEVPAAFVEAIEGERVDSVELAVWCRNQMAPFKVPVSFDFVESGSWPMTSTGKIAKRELVPSGKQRPD
jgi:fatty-acyl-CoA synthase